MARPVTNYGALPTTEQPDSDTEPEPFGTRPTLSESPTAPRCAWCGQDTGFNAGRDYTVKELRKWLAQSMSGTEAINVAEKFRRWLLS